MGKESAIQWTDATWNVARGCTKVDEDCKYCYMYRDSFDSTRYNPLEIIRTKTVFNLPLTLKQPSKIFTSSLTDFFHPGIDSYRDEAWDIIRRCPQHTFQILTKRPERIFDHLPNDWGEGWENVWLGTSVGSQNGIGRALDLVRIRKFTKTLFLSLEPLHGEINMRWVYNPEPHERRLIQHEEQACRVIDQHELLLNIDWVIVGGESGNETGKYRYRPCQVAWIELISTHCKEAGVPLFVKQMGTYLSKQLGMSDRHGSKIEEFPASLQFREFPKQKEVAI